MNIIKAYTTGIKTSLRWPKMIFVVYAVNLILGLSIALPFFFSFRSTLGNSMTAENLLNSLDISTIRELFSNNAFVSLFSQMRWTVLLYWLVSVFLAGGIIRTYNREEFNASTFFSGAGVNFLRFLAIDVIMIALMAVAIAIIVGLTFLIASLFNNIITEKPLFLLGGIAIFLIVCTVVLFLMISDYAKFYAEMTNTYRVLKAIRKAFGYAFGNFVRTYFLYFLLMVVPILVIILYHFTLERVGMRTAVGIIIMFFVQQAFILLRVWFRLWFLASEFELYADDYVQTIELEIPDYQLNKTIETTNTDTETAILIANESTSKKATETDQSDKADVIKIEIGDTSGDVLINSNGDTFNYEVAEKISENTENKEDTSKVVSGSYYVEDEKYENQNNENTVSVEVTTENTEKTETETEDNSKVVSGSYYVENQDNNENSQNTVNVEVTTEKTEKTETETDDNSKVVSGSYYVENQNNNDNQQNTVNVEVTTENTKTETETEDNSKVVSGSYYVENQDNNDNSQNAVNVEVTTENTEKTETETEDNSKVVSGSYYVENQDNNDNSQNAVNVEVTTENTEKTETEEDNSKVVSGSYYVEEEKYDNPENKENDEEIDEKIVIADGSPEQEILKNQDQNQEIENDDDFDEEDIENPYEQAIAALENSNNNEEDNSINEENSQTEENNISQTSSNDDNDRDIIYDEDGDGIDDSDSWGMSNSLGFVNEEEEPDEGYDEPENDPKVIKIYNEDQMKEIAKQQQLDAGLEPSQELTEVVPDGIENGVINPDPVPDGAYSEILEDDDEPAKG